MSIEFSIVVPTYNRTRQLTSCLESIARLEYPREKFEVIVVNDGGHEDIPARCGDVPIVVVSQRNRGPAASRNTGVRHARGRFVAFIDDDCTVQHDWLERLGIATQRNPEAVIGGRTVNQLTRNVYAATSQSIIDYVYSYYDDSPGRPRFFASKNLTVRRDLFHEIGGFDETFRTAEDREFCRRWIASGRNLIYDEAVTVVHAHDLSLASLHAQHFAYGRGALPYWKKATQNDVRFHVEPLSFYGGMFAAPFRSRLPGAPLIAALTVSAQLANAAGFFYELGRSLVQPGRTFAFVNHSVLHDKGDALGNMNVLQRIAGDGNDVSKLSRLDRSNALFPAEQSRTVQRSRG
jgi:GT2 family glycosyltransferase